MKSENMHNVASMEENDFWEQMFFTGDGDALAASVRKMEENSQWIDVPKANSIRIERLDPGPLFADQQKNTYHFNADPTLIEDTANNTGLLITLDGYEYRLLRKSAMNGLYRVARLSGTSLSKMSREKFVQNMNNSFETAKAPALALMRYGKVSGLQSGAKGGYMKMPISQLMDISVNAASARFGEVILQRGKNSHSFTQALWTLPDAQDELLTIYQDALKDISSHYAINMMPGIDFHTSDTTDSAASLAPVFITTSGIPLHLVEGVRVEHLNRGKAKEIGGVNLFEDGANKLFAKFIDMTQRLGELAKVKIYNPVNCCISMCNTYSIAAKYGQAAVDEIERFSIGERFITGHDFFLAMNELYAEAERRGASDSVKEQLEEKLAKIAMTSDFSVHDVTGTVSWKTVKKEVA